MGTSLGRGSALGEIMDTTSEQTNTENVQQTEVPKGTESVEQPKPKVYTEAEVTQLKQQLANVNRTVNEKSNKLREMEGSRAEVQALRDDLSGLKQQQQLFLALLAEGRNPNEDVAPEQRGDLLKRAQTMMQEAEAKRIAEQYRRRVESLGLTKKDRDYHLIKSFVTQGDFEAADAVLAELESGKQPNEEEIKPVQGKPKESEDERINRLVEEKLREKMETAGLLKTDTGLPSASGGSFQELEADYIAGKPGAAEKYEEARKKRQY